MKKFIVLFFLIMFVIGTDTFLISPLIPTLQSIFHISTEASGWMIGAYSMGSAVFALIAGPLSDGWNRKKVLLSGMACFAVSTILCGFAVDFWSMFLFRFMAGISAAFTAPQVWAAIPAVFPAHKIAKAMGVAYAGLAVSQALGVPIGSMLAVSSWSYPFFAIGIISLLLALFIFLIVPDMKPNHEQGAKASIFKRYVPLLTSGQAKGAFLAYFFIHLGSGAAFAFLGKWLSDRFQLSVDQVGYVIVFLGLGNLAGSFASGYVLKALNRTNTMIAGMLIVTAAFVVLPQLPSITAVSGTYFFIFAVLGILFPLIMGLLTSLNATIRGTISSLANSTMNAAMTVGSWTAGMLYALVHGFTAVALFTAFCLAVSLATFLFSGVLTVGARTNKEPVS